VRVGLIGLGRIGAFHATTLTSLDAVDELVVTDVAPAAVAAAVRENDARPAASTEELFAAGLDAVVIASSTATHLALLRAAVAAGVPAFCEKPVAQDPYAAADVISEVDRSGVPVQIGFPRRFDPAFIAAKAAVDAGQLGWLTTVRSTTMDPAPPPPAYIASSGGIFHDCAIHDIDAIRWVTGCEAVQVYATGANRGATHFRQVDDVDTASALLNFDDGVIGVISNTRYNGQGYDVRLELHGSAGSIAAGMDHGLPLRPADPAIEFPAGPPHAFFLDRFAAAFRSELAIFLDVAAGGRPSPCTMRDGLEASWIAEACTWSRRENRPVRLDEVRPVG
jgi:myo-inositol 2-dehydrogenase / D-chiro-inositol 1-dehydrogenase